MTPNRLAHMLISAAAMLALGACSVRPAYQVRVDNASSGTVLARIIRDASFEDDEILAQTRVRAGDSKLLGPVSTDPLERVELQISRPDDLQSLPETTRLSRGSWLATVSDTPITTWTRFRVDVARSDEPIAPPEESPPEPDPATGSNRAP